MHTHTNNVCVTIDKSSVYNISWDAPPASSGGKESLWGSPTKYTMILVYLGGSCYIAAKKQKCHRYTISSL